MNLDNAIAQLKANVANAYTALKSKGATMPQEMTTKNLATTVDTLDDPKFIAVVGIDADHNYHLHISSIPSRTVEVKAVLKTMQDGKPHSAERTVKVGNQTSIVVDFGGLFDDFVAIWQANPKIGFAEALLEDGTKKTSFAHIITNEV